MEIPEIDETDNMGHSHDCDADTVGNLCANWKDGCNGVTDGPKDGQLILCDSCKP